MYLLFPSTVSWKYLSRLEITKCCQSICLMITIVSVHQLSIFSFKLSMLSKSSRFSAQHVKPLQHHMVQTKPIHAWHQTETKASLQCNSLRVKLGLVYTWTGIHSLHETMGKVFPAFKQLSDFNKHTSEMEFPQVPTPNTNKPLGSNKSKTCQYICRGTRNAVHYRSKTASQGHTFISQNVLNVSNSLIEKSWMRLTTTT